MERLMSDSVQVFSRPRRDASGHVHVRAAGQPHVGPRRERGTSDAESLFKHIGLARRRASSRDRAATGPGTLARCAQEE